MALYLQGQVISSLPLRPFLAVDGIVVHASQKESSVFSQDAIVIHYNGHFRNYNGHFSKVALDFHLDGPLVRHGCDRGVSFKIGAKGW